MKREIIITSDGSHSISIPQMDITYHSTYGAIQESTHVFINSGFKYINETSNHSNQLSIFEMGFGTGLNALLTLIEAAATGQHIYYETIEAHPLEMTMVLSLNYCKQLNRADLINTFIQLHECEWNIEIALTPFFTFKKIQSSLVDYTPSRPFNIIYFDAFAPDVQPDLWTVVVFEKLYHAMQENAVLTTYCSKSIVRKAMGAAGLLVEKIPGPPHKREMVRAKKR